MLNDNRFFLVDQVDHIAWHKLNAALRLSIVAPPLSHVLPHILVNEYPKSGASWAAQMLAEAIGIPFPRNRLPMVRKSILHGHYMVNSGLKKRLFFWRDGRDVAVSWYYHFVVGHELTSKAAVEYIRSEIGVVDVDDLETNFPRAVEYFLTAPRHPKFTWASFVDKWSGYNDVHHLKYEDLKASPIEELKRATLALGGGVLSDSMAETIVEKYSFSTQTGRKPGEENRKQYLRKGISGDWKNYFSEDLSEMFNELAGKQLIKLGYEVDDSWVALTRTEGS